MTVNQPSYEDERANWPWVEDRNGWIVVDPDRSGPCRFTIGPGHTICRRRSVAALLRGTRRIAWCYCERHLYGRRFKDGKVLSQVHPDSTAAKVGYLAPGGWDGRDCLSDGKQ